MSAQMYDQVSASLSAQMSAAVGIWSTSASSFWSLFSLGILITSYHQLKFGQTCDDRAVLHCYDFFLKYRKHSTL